jgi:DNA-binding CsgD family transcriptional regulator
MIEGVEQRLSFMDRSDTSVRGRVNPVASATTPLHPTQSNQLQLFVGRQSEMEELAAVLEESLAGRFSCALIVGEPGIGKTRIVREFTQRVADQGITVIVGSCNETHETPAYGPWRAAISRLARHAPHETLPRTDCEGGPALAGVIPDLGKFFSDSCGGGKKNALVGRPKLLDAMARFLEELAERNGLVVVLDNAQWADPDSLTLLEHLAQEVPTSRIMILATARQSELVLDHPLTRVLGELVKLSTFSRIHLRGLSRDDVGQYVEHTLSGLGSDGLADSVYTGSEGNPLFMIEIVRDVLARGTNGAERGVPAGIRDAIGRRLTRLPRSCVRTLSIASVFGRRFDTMLLARLLDTDNTDRVVRTLNLAKRAGFIEDLEDFKWQFVHALFQETLYADLPAARRVVLHARIAGLIERYPSSAGYGWRGELLRHFVAGLGCSASERKTASRLVNLTLRAAEEALMEYAPERAIRLLDRTLSLVDTTGGLAAVRSDLAALLHLRGRAFHESGRPEGQEDLIRAFELYTQVGRTQNALEVALTHSHFRFRDAAIEVSLQSGPVEELRRKALTVVQPGSLDEGRLLSRGWDRRGWEKALSIARREHDQALETWTLARLAQLNAYEGDFSASLVLWRQLLDRVRRGGDREALHHHLYWFTHPLGVVGDLAVARSAADEMVQNARMARSRRMLWESHYACAALACMAGDWDACRENSEQVLSLSRADASTFSRTFTLMNLGLVEFETGNSESGYRCLHNVAGGTEIVKKLGFPCAAAKLVRITGDTSCLGELAYVPQPKPPGPKKPHEWWETARHVARSMIAILQGDRETAGDEKTYFSRWKGCYSPLGMAGRSYDAVLGLLESTLGEFDAAVGHLRDAVEFCRTSGLKPELAWSWLELAETLIRRSHPGDRRAASLLLDEGRDLARCLGMTPLLGKIDACSKTIERSPQWRATLSLREGEVLRLVSRGYTNREIGDRLFISERTVATHMQNIFAKLGVSNRAEATAWAMCNGIE